MTQITGLRVESFAAFQQALDWHGHAWLNVVFGDHDTGKTQLLKLLYAMARTLEDHTRKQAGPQPVALSELLAHKLRWTFLPQKLDLGGLVPRGSGPQRLNAELRWGDQGRLRFGFGRNSTVRINDLQAENVALLSGFKATFLPAREILSILDAIVATRETMEIAAFDDTCYDLVRDVRLPTVSGHWNACVLQILEHLQEVTGGGEVELQADGGILLRRGKERLNMHQTAEGIRKIAILSRLMRNGRLTPGAGCMLFFDEPEASLQPRAVGLFVDMLHAFARSGVRVYLSTRSLFLLKLLQQVAHKHRTDDTLLELRKTPAGGVTGTVSPLRDGLPLIPIFDTPPTLHDADVALDRGGDAPASTASGAA